MTEPRRYKITETTHPHYGEAGVWNGSYDIATGQWIIRLEECKHGVDSAMAARGHLRLLPS